MVSGHMIIFDNDIITGNITVKRCEQSTQRIVHRRWPLACKDTMIYETWLIYNYFTASHVQWYRPIAL